MPAGTATHQANFRARCLDAQGTRSKLEVLLLLLAEAPADAWVLWADNDAVFANRAFSFPFRKYEDAGKDVVIGGSEAEVLAGNGHRTSLDSRLSDLYGQPIRPRLRIRHHVH